MFVHLNVHSTYSKMRGTASPRQLLARAKSMGMDHLAFTEVNGLWGFIDFVKTAREYGVRPIAGCNLIGADDEAILLAESQKGYENISFILSACHENPTGSVLQWSTGHNSDIFFLSHKENTLRDLVKIIPASHLFVELRPGMQEALGKKLAEQFRLEMVVTGDVYFISPQEEKNHRVLRAIEKNATLSQLDPQDYKDASHYFRSERELIDCFPNSLEAINNTQFLAERCKTDWNFINTIFPATTLRETYQANHQLREAVYKGAKIRYPEMSEKVKERIEYELSIIVPKGFAPYFLVVADIVRQTDATIGRGSGAASIISYCLFITQVDPIKYNLQFERFIHPERTDMPDIDIDFPWDERDDIIDYIFKKYGKERAAMVSNQVFIKPRSAVREVSKVYGLSNEEIKSVTKRLGYFSRSEDLVKQVQTDRRFENVDLNDTLLEILKQSEQVIGAFRTSSVHCGGVIVTPDDIRKYVPVLMAPKGVQIVEWEKDQVEDSGLLKIDILGNRSLAVVRDTLKQLGTYRSTYIDYHTIPSDADPETETLIQSGRTMGIFYIESPAMRLLLRKARKIDFEHVVIYSSIIRPAANRYINMLVERIHGKPWKLLHPDLVCLQESYGIMVYEEQVSMVARQIAGFGYGDADYLRKVISKPKLRHLVPLWKKKFYDGAVKRGYSRGLAQTLWEMIQSFSGYSFCKPHSASYAMLSFTCAFLKTHYPAEFLAAVISNRGGFYSPFAYLSEAKRQGIEILKPDINLSDKQYKGRKNKIRMGFMAINNLQNKAIDNVLEAREKGAFKSLDDFILRSDLEFADAVALTKANCFDGLEPQLSYREIAFRIAYAYSPGPKPEAPVFKLPVETLSPDETRKLEMESFGFPVSEHPLQKYLQALDGKIQKAKDIHTYKDKFITLAGVYITSKEASTKKSEAMMFVTFEDETDIYECVMFPKVYNTYSDLLNWESLFIIYGKVEMAFDVPTISIEKLFSLGRFITDQGWADSSLQELPAITDE